MMRYVTKTHGPFPFQQTANTESSSIAPLATLLITSLKHSSDLEPEPPAVALAGPADHAGPGPGLHVAVYWGRLAGTGQRQQET